MNGTRQVVEAGDAALVLRLGDANDGAAAAYDETLNRMAIGIAADIRARRFGGVRDVLSTYRSVAVYLDPIEADVESIRAALNTSEGQMVEEPGAPMTIPVTYGGDAGPDLEDVAAFAGCDPETVIRRHTDRTYRVFMLGFMPGFPYMAAVDESIAAPRRSSPRLRVPAGSVAIAGRQTGVYPSDSPGGWQIIGHTPVTLFDPDRNPPALLKPGDRVRFVPNPQTPPGTHPQARTRPEAPSPRHLDSVAATVIAPGLFTTVQDSGRWGYQLLGVPPAGPMDPRSHRAANALVGNADEAATLETTLLGPEIRFERSVTIGIAGADLSAAVDGSPVRPGSAVECAPGTVLAFGPRKVGGRAYVAFSGGIDVPTVLGSRATHVVSGMGGVEGRVLKAGDRLTLSTDTWGGSTAKNPGARAGDPPSRSRRVIAGGARLRVMRGPQADFFDAAALAAFGQTRFIVSPQSNRMGYRLTGGRLPMPARGGDMMSDATFTGAVQVPPSGEPILLMADRQTTGGYPQIAVVISADLSVAGQLLPGDWIEFEWCSRDIALQALREQQDHGR